MTVYSWVGPCGGEKPSTVEPSLLIPQKQKHYGHFLNTSSAIYPKHQNYNWSYESAYNKHQFYA